MKEVVAYCRVACAKQNDPSAEVQLQEQMIRRYADARGLIICETYLDAGVSGGTLGVPYPPRSRSFSVPNHPSMFDHRQKPQG